MPLQIIPEKILWIEQAARVLKPTGTLFICGFSEILADIKHPATKYFKGCRWIIWSYKNKANLAKKPFAASRYFIGFISYKLLLRAVLHPSPSLPRPYLPEWE